MNKPKLLLPVIMLAILIAPYLLESRTTIAGDGLDKNTKLTIAFSGDLQGYLEECG